MTLATIISTISLAVSTATLVVVIVGVKKMQEQVDQAKHKANNSLDKFREAMMSIRL